METQLERIPELEHFRENQYAVRDHILRVGQKCKATPMEVHIPKYDGLQNTTWHTKVFKEDDASYVRWLPHPHFKDGHLGEILDSMVDVIGHTPMVKLTRIAKAYNIKCQIFAKCEFLNPGGSIKDRIARAMVLDGEHQKKWSPGDIIIEPTSGNTGIGLCLVSAVKGYTPVITMPEKMSNEKAYVMNALGAVILRTPTKAAFNDPDSHISLALKLAKTLDKASIPDQYQNPENPIAHYDGTGHEIYMQCDGKIDMVCISAGTGGTLTGISKYMKQKLPECTVVGVDPYGSILAKPDTLNGPLHSYQVEGIGYDFIPSVLDQSCADIWVKTHDAESFQVARDLISMEGMLVGGSSGAALAGAMKALKQMGLSDNPDIRVVVVLPDNSRNYIFKYLDNCWMVDNGFYQPKMHPRQYALLQDMKVNEAQSQECHMVTESTPIGKVLEILENSRFKNDIILIGTEEAKHGYVNKDIILRNIANGIDSELPIDYIMNTQIRYLSLEDSLSRAAQILEIHPFLVIQESNRVLLKDAVFDMLAHRGCLNNHH